MTTSYQSPNFDERAGGAKPGFIILHYTGMPTETLALEKLCDPAPTQGGRVSAHYFIRENGEVIQLVDDSQRAWHAGVSFWSGITDMNSHSIGIEIANPGHEFGYRPFHDAQIGSVVKLCRDLMQKYAIPPAHVLGHSDIAPERKDDPGELFPWESLAAQGVGVWPDVTAMDMDAAADMNDFSEVLPELLSAYGYNPTADNGALVRAFHRHFYPERFLDGGSPEQADSSTITRLLALLRAAHSSKT
jgi:N-acetylmuramoyl-L-alanine amidase